MHNLKIYKLETKFNHVLHDGHAENREVTFTGVGGFLCKHCYEPILADINFHTLCKIVKPSGSIVTNPITFAVTCSNCNNYTEWHDIPIDPNLVEAISIFNRKGYKTHMSCEGHSLFARAWITFYSNMFIVANKVCMLPYPWQLDEPDDFLLTSELWRISTGNNICTKRKKIESLLWFANALPVQEDAPLYNIDKLESDL